MQGLRLNTTHYVVKHRFSMSCTVTWCCATGSAQHLHSLPTEESLVYLALARGNVKQTHLRNKLLPFSICDRLSSMTKVICLEICAQKPGKVYIQITFLATANLMIYNRRLVTVQTDVATPDYCKCSSRVRLVLGIKSFILTAAHFSLPFSFMSASISAQSYFPPFSLSLCVSCIRINTLMIFFSPSGLNSSLCCVYTA